MNPRNKRTITITETSQNFLKAAEIADLQGEVIILENNYPKYKLINSQNNPIFELTDDEKIDIAAKRIMKRFKPAFEELAK